jgi:hypothetical protein
MHVLKYTKKCKACQCFIISEILLGLFKKVFVQSPCCHAERKSRGLPPVDAVPNEVGDASACARHDKNGGSAGQSRGTFLNNPKAP